jgi:SAM-dependent methyltransferase
MFRKVTPGTGSRLTIVDHTETYGRHILEKVVRKLNISLCVDLGCGEGQDLMTVKNIIPGCRCIGFDFGSWNREMLTYKGIESFEVNIENKPLPLDDETADLIIANQILEHTKEIYWINHEIFRTLKVGGHLYLGVPNVLSLHNRILGIFGMHPSCSKMISAHVRAFSRNDTLLFYKEIANSFAVVEAFYGSQFYPFPKKLARFFATLFPSFAVSVFFVIRKTRKYNGEFIEWLSKAPLQTNFYAGNHND